MAKKDPHWIENMHMKTGAEHDAAQSAGMSTAAYAKKTENSKDLKKRRAMPAETLMGLKGK